MILAGGNDQIALIEELRRYFDGDVEILLVDMSQNVRAIPFADRFLQISTMDKSAVLAAARREGIDYILTACGDQPLATMAYVSAQLGLPSYLTEEDVLNLTNKRYMKEKMVTCGIPTARHIYVNRNWNPEKLPNFKFPLVIKPVDSNGSKGVKKVMSMVELKSSLEEAFSYSLSGDVIIEEFKPGDELSIDIYVEGTTAILLSITSSLKIKENEKSFTIVQSYYPAQGKFSEERVLSIAQRIVDAWNLHDTPLLIQMIESDDEYNVIEFSARMGGGSKYYLIEAISGVDIMHVYVDMVMGNRPHISPRKCNNYAIMSYVYCSPGIYERLDGFDELVAEGLIERYFVYKVGHSTVTKSDTSSDRVAGFLVVGDSFDSVQKKVALANTRIAVLNPNGEDIMRHDLY